MMRLSLVGALLLLAGCGGEEWVLIQDLAGRSPPAACERLAGPEPGAVDIERLRVASDTTLLLVDAGAREVVELDGAGRRMSTFLLGEEGPRSVAMLADAVRLRDTLIVADAGRQRVIAFDREGNDAWTLQLDFPPQRLAVAGGRVLVTAAGMDGRLPSLLYELSDGSAKALDVPPAKHADAIARLFLNDVVLEGYPDGYALMAHHFVFPRGWRVSPEDGVETLRVPVAATTESSIGHLPPIPFREDELAGIAAPVIAAAADPRSGGLLYLTRTGRQRGGRSEKALVRADARLAYVASRLLEVNAVALAYLPSDPLHAIIVDYDGDWYRCDTP